MAKRVKPRWTLKQLREKPERINQLTNAEIRVLLGLSVGDATPTGTLLESLRRAITPTPAPTPRPAPSPAEPTSIWDVESELELAVQNAEEFLATIGSREPTEDEEDMLTELQELVTDFEEQLDELREREVDADDFLERRERLLDGDPALIDGEIDSWERLAADSG